MIDAGTSGSATVQDEASDQLLGGGVDITLIGPGATFDLNGFSDTINSLILTGGSVTTGAGALVLGGDVTTNAAATTAAISGNLDLGSGTRTFTVAQGIDPSGIDLSISAVIIDGGLTKAGAGTMGLSAANAYAGGTTINAGTLGVENNGGALGTGPVSINNSAEMMVFVGPDFSSVSLTNEITFNTTNPTAMKIIGGSARSAGR